VANRLGNRDQSWFRGCCARCRGPLRRLIHPFGVALRRSMDQAAIWRHRESGRTSDDPVVSLQIRTESRLRSGLRAVAPISADRPHADDPPSPRREAKFPVRGHPAETGLLEPPERHGIGLIRMLFRPPDALIRQAVFHLGRPGRPSPQLESGGHFLVEAPSGRFRPGFGARGGCLGRFSAAIVPWFPGRPSGLPGRAWLRPGVAAPRPPAALQQAASSAWELGNERCGPPLSRNAWPGSRPIHRGHLLQGMREAVNPARARGRRRRGCGFF